MRAAAVAIVLALAPLLAPPAHAHVTVVPGAGDSPENATALGAPPARAFGSLPDPGGYHYYSATLQGGVPVRLRLVAGEGALAGELPPWLVLVGPALEDSGFRPANLTLPPDPRVVAFAAGADRPVEVEPRYPARWRVLVDREWTPPATAEYFVVAYSQEGGGAFAVLVEPVGGAPALDRYLVPAQRFDAYAWSGESLPSSLAAHAAGALPALAFLAWRWTRGERYREMAKGGAAVAGLFLAASAGSLAWETWRLRAPWGLASPAWGLALAAAALAAIMLALASARGAPGARRRAAIAGVGVLAIVAYAGSLLGPAIAIVTAMLPDERKDER